MNILLISDIHGEGDMLFRLREMAQEADLLLIAGDLTNFGGKAEAERIIQSCSSLNLPLFHVHGNCDNSEAADYLSGLEGSLHLRTVVFSGMKLTGIGGSLPGPVSTPSTLKEDEFRELLEPPGEAYGEEDEAKKLPLIFVSHQPPHGTCADRLMKVRHGGSTSMVNWIEKYQPVAHFCGHIHEAFCVGRIGKTVLVNPGSFKDGRFAMVRIFGDRAEAELLTL
jgi:uncharacterized protein